MEAHDSEVGGEFDTKHLIAEVDGSLMSAEEIDRRLEQLNEMRQEEQTNLKEEGTPRPENVAHRDES